jgi:phosphatidylglycerophosphate synthase
MSLRRPLVWLVDSISLFRLVAALLFASLAFQNISLMIVLILYAVAILSDLVDGYLARRFGAETYFGKVIDLVSDKSLTIVSLLYAAERGINLLPLAMIAVRDIVMIGARLIVIDGNQLLPTNKVLGGIMALLLWGNTLFLISTSDSKLIRVAEWVYWICAVAFLLNLLMRIYSSASRIKASSMQER